MLLSASVLPAHLFIPYIIKSNRNNNNNNNNYTTAETQFCQQLQRVWPKLLQFPSSSTTTTSQFNNIINNNDNDSQGEKPLLFRLSLIIPCYRECGQSLASLLQVALSHCAGDPSTLQAILVDAGGCQHLQAVRQLPTSTTKTSSTSTTSVDVDVDVAVWGDIAIVPYPHGGGRGPCLNYGARFAKSDIFVFGHADTILPLHWDQQIQQALRDKGAMACAFSFAIDCTTKSTLTTTTTETTKPSSSSTTAMRRPPGIASVEWGRSKNWTGNDHGGGTAQSGLS
mmetsp:Transcript_18587/g.31732  ORF Transcript_18587/g.31732 Transcript_18587/m.31732 type:complete len:283 (+) Transcript_18587:472-1320(+)